MKTILPFIYISLLSTACIAVTTNWTGGAGTDWNNAANWSNGVPGGGDDAVILATANQPIIVGSFNLNNLEVNSSAMLTIASGSILTFNSVSGPALRNHGIIVVGGFLQFSTVFVGGLINYSGAEIRVANGGRLSFAEVEGVSFKNLPGATLTNNGTVAFNTVITTFSGSGIITGVGVFEQTTINGTSTFSPGSSPGKMTFDAGLMLIDSGGYICEIFSAVSHDTIDGTNIMLGGTLTILLEGYTPQEGDVFKIVTCESCTNTFDSLSLPDLDPGLTWHVAYGPEAAMLSVQQSSSIIWDGITSSDWNTASNWSGNAIPGPNDVVVIAPSHNPVVIGTGQNVVSGLLEILPCAEFRVDLTAIFTSN